MNVAILYSDTLERVNGTSERVVQIANELGNQGVDVTLSGFVEKLSKAPVNESYRVIKLPKNKFDFLGVYLWIARLIADALLKRGYDVMQIECFPFSTSLLLFFFFRPFFKKFVIVFHDKRFKNDPRESISGRLQIKLQRILLILCDAAITPGESIKKWFTDLHGEIAERKICVIPNGVPHSIMKNYDPVLFERKYHLTLKSFRVIFFGSMKFKPNYDDALRLYRLSSLVGGKFKENTKTDILFTIVGRGSEGLPRSNSFVSLGFVEDLNEMLFFSDAIILPHSPSYSGPHVKTLYAFLSGKPVIATCDAVKDLPNIEANKHFLLFDLNDNLSLLKALVKLCLDEDLRLTLTKNASSYVKDFSWSRISSLHIKTYERLLFKFTDEA